MRERHQVRERYQVRDDQQVGQQLVVYEVLQYGDRREASEEEEGKLEYLQ